MIVNGVTLPDIPAEVLAEKPNAVVTHTVIYGTDIYSLAVSSQPFDHGSAELLGQEMLLTHGEGQNYMLSNGVWDDLGTTSQSPFGVQLGEVTAEGMTMEYTLVWTNQTEFKEIVWIDLDTMEWGTEPKEEEPEYAERYSILGSILVGTARQIMRLTDSTEKVKPEEFEPKLEGINIQLQELTVTATEEVQTITPPSGVYGFSKVIVEAVEDSGGTGSGGEGDDAGDTSDILLVESSKNFGYEWNYATSLYNGVLLPNPINWPYLLVYNTSNAYYINGANSPFVLDNGSLRTSDGSRCAVGTVTRKTALDANALSSVSWNMTFSESGYATKGKTLVVANHEVINKSNGSTYISPTGEIVASGEGVFAALPSDARYIVKKTTLDRLAFHIQKKMGTSAKLSVVDIDAYLDGL